MTITSQGYAGTIAPNSTWANLQRGLGSEYWVHNHNHCRITGVVGATNTLRVAAGMMGGFGILDTVSGTHDLVLPSVGSGSRYYMVYTRREWGATQATSIVYEDCGASQPANPPARNENPGVIDDQPMALVRVTAGQPTPTIVYDLRACGGQKSFIIPSKVTPAWFNYLSAPAVEVKSGDTYYYRDVTGYAAVWRADPEIVTSGPGKGNPLSAGGFAGWVTVSEFDSVGRKSGAARSLRIVVRRSGATLTLGSNGGLGDQNLVTIGNSDFHPPNGLVAHALYRHSNNATFGCTLEMTAAGVIVLRSGAANTQIPQRSSGDWSIRGDFSWIAG